MSEEKRLYRSRTDRKIGGVVGGLAKYFGLEPSMARLGYVIFTVVSCSVAFWLYIIMLIIVPEEPY